MGLIGYPASFWIGFHILVIILLVIDLGVFQRKSHVVAFKEACLLSGFWIAVALLFNLGVYYYLGAQIALQFFTGYLIEKSLSVDNLFIFLLIFSYFRTPAIYYHKILFWGIVGALIFRLSLILMGVKLVSEFKWLVYVIGILLPISGIRLMFEEKKRRDPSKGFLYRQVTKLVPVAKKGAEKGGKFFVREGGHWKVTSLFLTLVMIECTDILMALDSIPAIFAITTDAFVIYTSNVFAILGLRALYFVLASTLEKLRHLRKGLAAILIFVGAKMLLANFFKITVSQSLLIIGLILLVTVLISLRSYYKGKK